MNPNPADRIVRQATYFARGGNRVRARELFLRAVEIEATNLTAWLWLVDLHDTLPEQIDACRKALALDPGNEKVQARLNTLLRQNKQAHKPVEISPAAQIQKAENLLASGQNTEALTLLLQIVEKHEQEARAWELLSDLVEASSDQIVALENLLTLQPDNQKARARLAELQHFHENPLDLAARLEEEGKLDEAIVVLQKAALKIQYGPEFDQIYRTITRLEIEISSGIVYVKPVYSIARLSGGPALLYLLLMLIHNQLKPFAFTPLLWVGLVTTLIGGFFLAVASVRSRHPIWMKFFDEPGGGGSPMARFTLALAGWFLLVIAFVFLLTTSYDRLHLVDINAFIY